MPPSVIACSRVATTASASLCQRSAPIRATVLKSKTPGDIRAQAKEKVPGAIFHAAGAMKPHFDKCVDDFATRLREFVTSAGNALYKGISEVLERTIADRRYRGGEAAELQAATAEQIAQVAALRIGLGELRPDLWKLPAGTSD